MQAGGLSKGGVIFFLVVLPCPLYPCKPYIFLQNKSQSETFFVVSSSSRTDKASVGRCRQRWHRSRSAAVSSALPNTLSMHCPTLDKNPAPEPIQTRPTFKKNLHLNETFSGARAVFFVILLTFSPKFTIL